MVKAKDFLEDAQKLLKKLSKGLKFKRFKHSVNEFGALSDSCHEMIRPGAILKIRGGYLELVGTVNRQLGVCDDCVRFTAEDIVSIAYLDDIL